jgi:hypothetical protein
MFYWWFHSEKENPNQLLIYSMEVNMYIGFWTLKPKCTQYGLCGQATFKNAKVRPGSGNQGSDFFGVAPAHHSDACNARHGYLESPVKTHTLSPLDIGKFNKKHTHVCVLPSINRNFTCDALLIVACAILGTTSSCHVSPNQILKKPSFEFISFSSRETMNLKHYITCSLSLLHKDAMVATTLLSKMHLFHLILIHSIIMLTTLEEIVSKSTLLCGDRTQENA